MLIKGFQKLTLLDFPGHTACTVFTGGCNLRCPFCHNAVLVTKTDDLRYEEEEIFAHLEKRRGIIDGVAVTGGEPLLQPDIERFLYEIKDAGFAVKLDTNGCFPDKLAGIIELGLADYIAMDVKNRLEKYAETVGIAGFDTAPVEKSIDLLLSGGVDFEFRTTVVNGFHTPEDISALSKRISGAPHYFLQNFVDSGNLIDENCTGVSRDTMREMLDCAREFIPNAELRGM